MPEYVWIYDNRQGSEYLYGARSIYNLLSTYREIGVFETEPMMESYWKIIIAFNYFCQKTQS